MFLRDKTIVIVSQLDWGDMFISKHHYAVELSKLGNIVYYMNGPDRKNELKRGEIKIEETAYPNLFVIKHNFFFPYIIVFKARLLFNRFISIHISRIIKKIEPARPLIIWSFDQSNTVPLKYFPKKSFKIYMPVDELNSKLAFDAAESAQAIFSVTNEIVNKLKYLGVPSLFVNHGVAANFLNTEIKASINQPVVAALSGNFLRPDIDRPVLLSIVRQHSNVLFECWGSSTLLSKNAKGKINKTLGGYTDQETQAFIEEMIAQPNVIMHGSVPPAVLSNELKKADVFLICYDINKDQSGGTNYHKVLEYLACGKATVSNNITTYQQYPGLLLMPQSRENNNELPSIFSNAINNLLELNSVASQQRRIDFAKQYLYSSQVKKIEAFIEGHVKQ